MRISYAHNHEQSITTYTLGRHTNTDSVHLIVAVAVIEKTSNYRRPFFSTHINDMYLEQAKSNSDWQAASRLLLDVMMDLNRRNLTLWTEGQLTMEGLGKQYKAGELYLAKNQGDLEGVVFLQEQDPYFWPELSDRDTLFLHKLAVHPKHKGSNKGMELIKLVEQEATRRELAWLRLDCDDREPLHRFYVTAGFQLVDIKNIDAFRVARYEKSFTI